VLFYWLPAHSGIELNELVDRETKRLTEKNAVDSFLSFARVKTTVFENVLRSLPTIPRPNGQSVGRFIKSIDLALPGPHTKTIYDALSSKDAAILSLLRANHCRLKEFLHRIGASDIHIYSYGRESETVAFFSLLS
jgi:hypothetical protein